MIDNDYIAPILKRLTINGARNLKGTLEHPSPEYPDAINGDRRIDTGLGKWTHIASLGVEANLRSLGLAEDRETDIGNHQTWTMIAITPLGRDVAAIRSLTSVDRVAIPWSSADETVLHERARDILDCAAAEMEEIEPRPFSWVNRNAALRAIIHLIEPDARKSFAAQAQSTPPLDTMGEKL